MARIEDSIEIKAAPENVWKMISHERLLGLTYLKKVEPTSKEDNRLGATHHMTSELYEIIKIEWDGEITEWLENRKYSWRTIGGPFTGFGSMNLEPVESGTRFTMSMDYEIPYSYLGKLLDKILIQEALESEFREGLNELKALLEK